MKASGDRNPDSVATSEFEGSALSALSNLNSIHSFGVPTYRNVTQKNKIGESVIDLCLTTNPNSVQSFQVHTDPLGTSAHSAHRAIVFKISGTFTEHKKSPIKTEKFGLLTIDNKSKFSDEISHAISKIDVQVSKFLDKIKHSASENVLHHISDIFDKFLSNINLTKEKVLGKKVIVQGESFSRAPRALHKIQKKIDAVMTQLSEPELGEKVRSFLVNQLEKFKTRKCQIEEKKRALDYEKLLCKMEKMCFTERSKFLSKKLREIRGQSSEISGVIKNLEGKHSTNENEFMDYWVEFYSNLYSNNNFKSKDSESFSQIENNKVTPSDIYNLNKEISFDEFEQILEKLPRNKAPGDDKIVLEDFLCLNESARRTLHKLIQIFWHLESVPQQLKTCILVPLLKDLKGDIHDCGNFRPIALMSTLLPFSILNERLCRFLEDTGYFHDEQSGFRKNRSIMDCHLILKEIWNSRKYKIGPRGGKKTDPLFLAFIDLKKAFDKVPREKLWAKLAFRKVF